MQDDCCATTNSKNIDILSFVSDSFGGKTLRHSVEVSSLRDSKKPLQYMSVVDVS